MSRLSNAHLNDVLAAHGVNSHTVLFGDVPPDDMDFVAVGEDSRNIGECFAEACDWAYRKGVEIREVYVTLDGTWHGVEQRDLFEHGRLAAVLYPRPPSTRITGLMQAKDEADIIAEVVTSLFEKGLERLYLCCGDVATRDVVEGMQDARIKILMAEDMPQPLTDGGRQYLLDLARLHAKAEGDRRTHWIWLVQGDEIYDDSIFLHTKLAQETGAVAIGVQVATFVLHESQAIDWDWTLPLKERLPYYVWGGNEFAAFKDQPWLHYKPEEHMRVTLHGIFPSKWLDCSPVRRHYPFSTPRQAKQRVADRLASGWQPNYASMAKIFYGDECMGLTVKRYHGWFSEAKRPSNRMW